MLLIISHSLAVQVSELIEMKGIITGLVSRDVHEACLVETEAETETLTIQAEARPRPRPSELETETRLRHTNSEARPS